MVNNIVFYSGKSMISIGEEIQKNLFFVED